MLNIAKQYTAEHGDDAIERFVADLMAGDPDTFKAGYSRENAVIAAADAFEISRIEVAHKLTYEPVKIGESYPFYSTLEGVDGSGIQCRKYTGQTVLVTADNTDETDYDEIQERIFTVQAEDGVRFSAWEGELNGWFLDTKQYYTPEGEWQS